jgi:diguanylate cyclase (GGDEF)-like protein
MVSDHGDPRIRQYCDAVEALRAGRLDVEVATGPGDDAIAELGRSIQNLAQAHQTRLSLLTTLSRVTEKVNSGMTLDEVLGFVYDSFQPLIPYDRIGVALIEDGGVVRARWARSAASEIHLGQGYAASLEGSSLQQVMSSGEPRLINDLEAYLADHPQSDSTRRIVCEGMRSSLTGPLVARGRPVGFIFFSSLRPHAFGDPHTELFRQIAGQLSLIVEKSLLLEDLAASNRKLLDAQQALQHQAAHDTLTSLWNRRGIVDVLGMELARADREGSKLALLVIDIDHFKQVNDAHGHAVGDEVLCEVARRLQEGLRSTEVLGRYGGDEFIAVLRPCTVATATRVSERLRALVDSTLIPTRAGLIPLTVTVGAMVSSADQVFDPDGLIEVADHALYRAKRAGRNRTEITELR